MKFGKFKKENDNNTSTTDESIDNDTAVEETSEDGVIIEDDMPTNGTSLLQEKQKQIDELNDKYLRKVAEFDNYQKRTTKEKMSRYDDATRDTIEKLLPIIDNFERAISSAQNKDDALYKGVEMIYRQIKGYLEDLNIEELVAKGESFDANIHMAVSHVQDENCGENQVVEVLQKGYKHKDKIIRPATVIVAN